LWGGCTGKILTQKKTDHLGNACLIGTAWSFDLSAFITLIQGSLEIGADTDQLLCAYGFHSCALGRLKNCTGTIE
tara:strand:+ start:2874 stop:3098 length:225 start_codon:yes stop_codon:yes gene_type:complete